MAGVLVVVVIVAAVRLRATGQRAEAAEAERDRLKAEGEALRAQLAERDRTVRRARRRTAGSWRTPATGCGRPTPTARSRSPTPPAPRCSATRISSGDRCADLTHEQDRDANAAPEGWAGRPAPPARRRLAQDRRHALGARRRRLAGHRPRPDRRGARPAAPRQAPQIERPGVAVVRWPVVDGRREVVGYELVGDGSVLGGVRARRADRARRRPAGVGRPRRATSVARAAARPRRAAARARRAARARAGAGRGRLRARRSTASRAARRCSTSAGSSRSTPTERGDDELRALIAEPAARGLVLVATGVARRRRVHPLPGARLLALPGRVLRPPARRVRQRRRRPGRGRLAAGARGADRGPTPRSRTSSGSSAPTSASRSRCCATSTRRSSRSRARSTPCARR